MSTTRLPVRPPLEALTPRLVLEAWSGITREQVAMTFLFGLALFVYRVIVTIDIRVAHFIFVADQMKAFGLLLALAVADRVTHKDPQRRGAYVLALLAAAVIVVPLTRVVVGLLVLASGNTSPAPGGIGLLLNIFCEYLMIAGAAVWIVNDRRRARIASARLHEAELQRIAAERASVESELQAMQARVDPAFLLGTLSEIGRRYRQSEAEGEALLDMLIAFLHAAVPSDRGTASTLRGEIDLVRAYLDIASARADGRLTTLVRPVEDAVGLLRVPAMLLLPLVDFAIAQGAGGRDARALLEVEASADDRRLRVRVCHGDVVHLRTDDHALLAPLRQRLEGLYGDTARVLITRPQPERLDVSLELPQRHARSMLAAG